ncbi:MFS transporter [Virgisporangium aliadipatigenens]|uniref:MFS transporter n=1 Tax=Virgisporangium aliadipatigenens TaxID=741659 RepID=UPI001942C4D1|nr:MFS transporter [Virgisporangium aliadipatigenens]
MPGRGGLFRHADFRRLFLAHGVSQLGAQVTYLALPLVAITYLHASTFEIGVLTTLESLAFLVIGLPAGAWCDRMRRRRVLITTDLVRAGALLSIPVAAALGVLSVWQLYTVVLIHGACTVFFDVSGLAFLPSLIGRERLIEGNGKMESARQVALAAGPTLAGFLVEALKAPFALVADAVSYLWSAAWLSRIRAPDVLPPRADRQPLRVEIAEGLRFVLRNPVLRAVAATGAIAVVGISISRAILVLFLVRQLGLTAGTIGLLFSVGSVASIGGAMVTTRLARRLGAPRALIGFCGIAGAGSLLIPLTGNGWALGFLVVGETLQMASIVAYNVTQVSYRQRICPDHLLGRMNATMRFLMWGTTPVGGLLGGVLGTAIGLRPTLWTAGALLVVATLPLVLSPLGPAAVRGDREFLQEPVLLGQKADGEQA